MPKRPGQPADSSSRKLADQGVAVAPRTAIEMRKETLVSLLNRLPDAVLVLGREWRIVFANEQALRISRLTPEDFNSRTHWEIYPETVGTNLERLYRQVMQTGESGHIEFFYAPFDVWLDVHVLSMPDGLALHYRDITTRRRAEELRDTSARKLEQVFAAASDSIVCIDRNWKCIFANRAATAILKTDDLIGADLWTRFPGNQEEPFASNYRQTMEQRVATEFEAYYPAPLDIWFRVNASPFEDGIIIFSNEITDRKRAEALRDATAVQLAQVFEATTDAITSMDRDWKYTYMNARAVQFLGRDDLVGKTLWQEYPYTVDSAFSMNFRRCMEERTPRIRGVLS